MCSWWYRGRHRTGDLTVDDLILRAAHDAPDPWAGLLAAIDFEASHSHRLGNGGLTVAELEATHVVLDEVTMPWVTFRRGGRIGARDFPDHQPPPEVADPIRAGWGNEPAAWTASPGSTFLELAKDLHP